MSAAEGLDFIVNKKDWHEARFVPRPAPTELGAGRVRFRVDRVAFTANNISYAFAGDMLGYWRFFPADEGYGRIPAMGYGDVIASNDPRVGVGTRCFGFYPMSRHLEIEPGTVSEAQIVDGVAHREGLAPAYNQYAPVTSDPHHAPEHEDRTLLLRGLFMTSFLAEDYVDDADYHGADAVLISSASSKTSIALAHQVRARGRARAVGLTSARNLDFVKGLGLYDEVALYDEIPSLPRAPSVFVDMAGDGEVTRAIHEHLTDRLRYVCTIGATHWEAGPAPEGLPGPKAEFFFAPGQIQKRIADWGPAEFQQRLGRDWVTFRDASGAWLEVRRGYGRDAVERVYRETLEGRAAPGDGHVISLWDDEAQASGR